MNKHQPHTIAQPLFSIQRHTTKQNNAILRTVPPRLDPIQSFFEGLKNVDHLDAAQGIALVKGHLSFEDLGDRDRLVDGTSHGLEDNLVRVVRLVLQVSHSIAALDSMRYDAMQTTEGKER